MPRQHRERRTVNLEAQAGQDLQLSQHPLRRVEVDCQ
jgi:hypothetical protein